MAAAELDREIKQRQANTARKEWAIPSLDAAPALKGVSAQTVAGAQKTISNLESDFLDGEAKLEAVLPTHLDLRFLLFRLQVLQLPSSLA